MFNEYLKTINIRNEIVDRTNYHPYPSAEERHQWNELSESLKLDLIKDGEKYLDFEWPVLPAIRFMDYRRDGNRSRYEALHFKRRQALASLVVSECIEFKGRFIDDIINGIWCICEESFWGVPAHSYNSRFEGDPLPDITEPIIDLFASETAGLLTWTVYLLKNQLDQVSQLISERIAIETKRRILDPFLERNDFWWMGYNPNRKVNNWNPWVHSNCLTAFLILEEDENRRLNGIEKVMNSLDKFMEVYHPDGGCDEGTSYWGRAGASLFDCLEQLYTASEGKINFYSESIVKEIGRFIYKSYIDGDYFINFADGGARVKLSGNLVYRYGKRIGDSRLMAIGANAFHRDGRENSHIVSPLRILPEIFSYDEIMSADSNPPYIRDSWLDGIQVMAAREQEGSAKGLYLAAKGGHNAESHNHNDIGQFIVYSDGKPVIIDIGVETYTKKTFSESRYEIWTMQSAYHNLPTINGIQQAPGEQYRASEINYFCSDNIVEFSMDISTAYPEDTKINQWKRGYKFLRGDERLIEVSDQFSLKEASKDIMFSLMTSCKPEINPSGNIILMVNEDNAVAVEFNEDELLAGFECISIQDARLLPIWGNQLYRIVFKARNEVDKGNWLMKFRKLK
jgi:hypothetical protein